MPKGCPWNRKRRPSSYHVRETESCDKGDGRSGAGHPEGRKWKYVARGNRNIKINGENMKPILAKAAAEQENVTVLNHVNITDYKTENKKSQAQLDLALMRIFSMTLMRKQFFVPQVVQRDFTDRIIRDFPDIRCGILRLTQVQDMQWDFFPVRR